MRFNAILTGGMQLSKISSTREYLCSSKGCGVTGGSSSIGGSGVTGGSSSIGGSGEVVGVTI